MNDYFIFKKTGMLLVQILAKITNMGVKQ